MTSDVLIRPATRDDLGAVRGLLVETWHDTYDPLLGRERVIEITDRWHAVEALARQLDLPDSSFLIAARDREAIGHAFAQAPHPPVLVLGRLYVRPALQRQGVGGRLLAAVTLCHPQASLIRLMVEAGNAKGVRSTGATASPSRPRSSRMACEASAWKRRWPADDRD